MAVFISYARNDQQAVRNIHGQLEDMRHQVFFDEDMVGGHDWWQVVLERIRWCDAFLFVLTPDSAMSRACGAELAYAVALDKAVLGVKVREVSMERAPHALQLVNVQNLLYPVMQDWFNLDYAIDEIEQNAHTRPMPSPLPPDPPPPIAELTAARAMVEAPSMDSAAQRTTLAELQERVQDPDDRRAVVGVLEKLCAHPDVLADVKATALELVQQHREQTLDAKSVGALNSLVAHFQAEKCTPIIGSGLTDWLWGTRRDLARQWALRHEFPLGASRRGDLPQVAQFLAVQQTEELVRINLGAFYRDQLKRRFPKIIEDVEVTTLDKLVVDVWREKAPSQPAEPHAVLAQMPCSVYLTTQSTTLLSQALIDEGKEPVVDFCRWNLNVDTWPPSPLDEDPDYIPSPQRPLVYHVFGILKEPDSIVITEDDYFDFLSTVAADPSLIPPVVQERLADSSLLFLGFGPQDWDMRVLLRALISREIAGRRSRFKHVAAVINQQAVASPAEARNYIESYFEKFREPSIHVFWSSVADFSAALAQAWEAK